MAWTYSSPFDSNKDTVRYLVADTDSDDQLATDEEILWQLTQFTDTRQAAIAVAQQIAVKFARYATVRSQDISVDWNARAMQYRQIAEDLKRQQQETWAQPYAGGISESDKEAVEEDTDRTLPAFTTRLHDRDTSVTTSEDVS